VAQRQALAESLDADGHKADTRPGVRPAVVPAARAAQVAVAIWRQEEDGEPIYEIERENIWDEFSGTTGTGLSRS
jgi:hypothetical protein